MKRVYRSELLADVEHFRHVLEQAGIASVVRNAQLSGGIGEIPPLEVLPELWVLDDAAAADAERILADVTRPAPAGATAWRCEHCGETNEAQFGACWQCGRPAP